MSVLDALGQALTYFADWQFLFMAFVGIIIGLILGIIPGLGGMIGLALMLPLVIKMNPVLAFPLLIGMHACAYTGGAITAVLVNIPGTGPNAATLFDGFPMTQKGQAGRALGAAIGASGTGGSVVVFLAMVMVPLVIPLVLALRSADMVFLILMGIAFIAVLGRGSMVKGLISGGVGLMMSLIGFQWSTGIPRFTFGSLYLYEGLPLVPVTLGLFALPVVLDLAVTGGTIAKGPKVTTAWRDVWEGVKDVFRHWRLWIASSLIGYIVGIIPGIGGETASFVAYGYAKQTSKHPLKFGTGMVEGVIAPETANNAKEAGSLLTTMALGVPGSSAMAILIGAFLLLGLTPGPRFMTEHLDLAFNILLLVILSNIVAAAICLLAAPKMAKIASVPARILFPMILLMVFVGSFAFRASFNDILVAVIFGAVGLVMVRFGFNRPALFLGFVLGGLFEEYFFLALGVAGPLFFLRPISLVLIVLTIAILFLDPVRNAMKRRKQCRTA